MQQEVFGRIATERELREQRRARSRARARVTLCVVEDFATVLANRLRGEAQCRIVWL